MRKIYQLLVLMVLSLCFIPAKADTKTTIWTFPSTAEYLDTSNYHDLLPAGWDWDEPNDDAVWRIANKSGTYGLVTPLVSYIETAGHMVFYAHKGTLTFSVSYMTSQYSNTVTISKVTKDGDTYIIGDAIYDKAKVSTNAYTFCPLPEEGAFDIPEDGYYTFTFAKPTIMSQVVNTYESEGASEYSLAGTVVDEDGNPVEAATVEINSQQTTTDSAGKFSFSAIEEGAYSLSISKDGYTSKSVPVNLTADTDLGDIVLQSPVTTLVVTVYTPNYNLLTGAEATLYGSDASAIATVTTNGEGDAVFTIKGQLDSSYSFKITYPGMQVYERSDISLDFGQTKYLNAVLKAALTEVAVTVTKAGQPYNGAYCYIYDEDYTKDPSTARYVAFGMTDEEGKMSVTIEAPLYNPYTVKVVATGCEDVIKQVTLNLGLKNEITAELEDITYTFNAKVVNGADQQPVTGATVEIYSGDTLLYTATEGQDGNYAVAETITDLMVADKILTLKVTKEGYKPYTEDFSFELGNFDKTIELQEMTYTFNVQVVNAADQAPVTGAKVEILDGENVLYTAAEGEDGNYAVAEPIAEAAVEGKTLTLSVTKADFKPYSTEFTFVTDYNGKVELEAYGATVITGKITIASTGEVAEDIQLTLTPAEGEALETEVDKDGTYTFSIDGALAASYTLATQSSYYKEFTQTITDLVRGETKELNIALEDIILSYTAKVVDAETKADVKDVKFMFNDTELTANADGEYTTTVTAWFVGHNTPVVQISAPYYEDLAKQPVFFYGEDVETTYEMTPIKYSFTAIVNGKSEKGEVAPLSDAKVEAKDDKGNTMEVTNEGNGKYSFIVTAEAAAVNEYTVTVSAEGYDALAPYVFKFDKEDAEHEFELQETSGIDALYMDAQNGAMIFDLQGRRISASQVKNLNTGIYIVNGKKVMVRK